MRKFFPLILFFAATFARAERLPLKYYTVADGLPSNIINRIFRDSRGFLWFCTNEGLSRFDGYTFTNFGALPCPKKTGSPEYRLRFGPVQ
jgi:ligand-binding sensor domain-containing protein